MLKETFLLLLVVYRGAAVIFFSFYFTSIKYVAYIKIIIDTNKIKKESKKGGKVSYYVIWRNLFALNVLRKWKKIRK